MIARWQQRLALLMLTGFAATGCAGPTIGLDPDVKAVGYDVFFGTPTALAPAAPANSTPLPPGVAPVIISQPAPNAPEQLPAIIPSPAATCPTASPLAYPAVAASFNGPTKPPVAATYGYRVSGSLVLNPGTPEQAITYYPANETRQFSDITQPDASTGSYAFKVTRKLGGVTTTTVYSVNPHGPEGPTPADPPTGHPAAGMFLRSFTSSNDVTFQPADNVGVQVMAFPAIPANPYRGVDYDAPHQTSMVMNQPHVVKPGGLPVSPPDAPDAEPSGFEAHGSHKVDACGTILDSVENLIRGKFTVGTATIDFEYTFDVATQFGGLIVADKMVESGTDPKSGKPFKRTVSSTINQVPRG
jgi:hypothetical protein